MVNNEKSTFLKENGIRTTKWFDRNIPKGGKRYIFFIIILFVIMVIGFILLLSFFNINHQSDIERAIAFAEKNKL